MMHTALLLHGLVSAQQVPLIVCSTLSFFLESRYSCHDCQPRIYCEEQKEGAYARGKLNILANVPPHFLPWAYFWENMVLQLHYTHIHTCTQTH